MASGSCHSLVKPWGWQYGDWWVDGLKTGTIKQRKRGGVEGGGHVQDMVGGEEEEEEQEERKKKKGGLVAIYHCDSWPCGWPWDLTASSSALIFFSSLRPLPSCPHLSAPLLSHSSSMISDLLFFPSSFSSIFFQKRSLLSCISPPPPPPPPSFPLFHRSNTQALRMHEQHRWMCCIGLQESRTEATVYGVSPNIGCVPASHGSLHDSGVILCNVWWKASYRDGSVINSL